MQSDYAECNVSVYPLSFKFHSHFCVSRYNYGTPEERCEVNPQARASCKRRSPD